MPSPALLPCQVLDLHDGGMNLPSGVPVFKLRDALAEALWAHVKANRLAAVCEYLGLAPQQPDEDPYNSKRSYVHTRLEDKPLPDLMAIARRVVDEYGDDDLQQLLAQMGLHGVSGELKNSLTLPSWSPKPRFSSTFSPHSDDAWRNRAEGVTKQLSRTRDALLDAVDRVAAQDAASVVTGLEAERGPRRPAGMLAVTGASPSGACS
jgi:hypothetical protein